MWIPPRYDESFLAWLRETCESAWANYPVRTLDEYRLAGVGGVDWQPGTRWHGGLSDDEIGKLEGRWGFTLPADLRLFLRVLHATDRPMVGAGFGPTGVLEARTRPGFFDWHDDVEAMHARVARALTELLEAAESFGMWLSHWGPRPSSSRERRARLEALILRAPPLIPLHAHRFLVAAFPGGGNPVLSICGSDVMLYGRDLREYLLNELSDVIGLMPHVQEGPGTLALRAQVPFWGDFVPVRAKEPPRLALAN